MTKDEFGKYASAIRTYYPRENVLPTKESMDLWYLQLKDLDYRVACTGLYKWVNTSKWPPTIADIREMCLSVTNGEKSIWSDGWEEVLTAIRSYGYMRENEALESMSEITRQVVRRLGWQTLCMSEEIGVERANFRQIYEQLAEREHLYGKLPNALRNVIEQFQEHNQKVIEVKSDVKHQGYMNERKNVISDEIQKMIDDTRRSLGEQKRPDTENVGQ